MKERIEKNKSNDKKNQIKNNVNRRKRNKHGSSELW